MNFKEGDILHTATCEGRAPEDNAGRTRMQLARRASLIVVLLLLASVCTASAECAWVLWFESLNQGQTGLVLRSAWPTYEQCEAERRAGIGRYQGLSTTEHKLQAIPGGTAIR